MNYIIAYNHTQTEFASSEIHKTITTMPGVQNWWHYIPSIYIISSDRDVKYVADKIIAKHPGLLFIATAVNLSVSNGVLNKNAWEWISQRTKNLLRIKASPQSKPNISTLLGLPPITSSKQPKSLSELLDELAKIGS